MERQIKIIVEKHSDRYLVYPLGIRDTFESTWRT